jgi:hypothetical protein
LLFADDFPQAWSQLIALLEDPERLADWIQVLREVQSRRETSNRVFGDHLLADFRRELSWIIDNRDPLQCATAPNAAEAMARLCLHPEALRKASAIRLGDPYAVEEVRRLIAAETETARDLWVPLGKLARQRPQDRQFTVIVGKQVITHFAPSTANSPLDTSSDEENSTGSRSGSTNGTVCIRSSVERRAARKRSGAARANYQGEDYFLHLLTDPYHGGTYNSFYAVYQRYEGAMERRAVTDRFLRKQCALDPIILN